MSTSSEPHGPASETRQTVVVLTFLGSVEGVALGLGGGRCPLTPIAERMTTERGPTVDIYLPLLIARFNVLIFTPLLLFGEGVALAVLWSRESHVAAVPFAAGLCFACAAAAAAFLRFSLAHRR